MDITTLLPCTLLRVSGNIEIILNLEPTNLKISLKFSQVWFGVAASDFLVQKRSIPYAKDSCFAATGYTFIRERSLPLVDHLSIVIQQCVVDYLAKLVDNDALLDACLYFLLRVLQGSLGYLVTKETKDCL